MPTKPATHHLRTSGTAVMQTLVLMSAAICACSCVRSAIDSGCMMRSGAGRTYMRSHGKELTIINTDAPTIGEIRIVGTGGSCLTRGKCTGDKADRIDIEVDSDRQIALIGKHIVTFTSGDVIDVLYVVPSEAYKAYRTRYEALVTKATSGDVTILNEVPQLFFNIERETVLSALATSATMSGPQQVEVLKTVSHQFGLKKGRIIASILARPDVTPETERWVADNLSDLDVSKEDAMELLREILRKRTQRNP